MGREIGNGLPRNRGTDFFNIPRRVDRSVPTSADRPSVLDKRAAHESPEETDWLETHPPHQFDVASLGPSWRKLDGTGEFGTASHDDLFLPLDASPTRSP